MPRILALALAVVVLALTPSAALAQPATPPDGEIEYAGTIEAVPFGNAGPGTPQTLDRSIGVVCDDGVCVMTGYLMATDGAEPFVLEGTAGEWSFPGYADRVCSEGVGLGPGWVRVSLTAGELTVVAHADLLGPIDCGDVRRTVSGLDATGTLFYASGDRCLVDAEFCPDIVVAEGAASAPDDVATRPLGAPGVLSELSTPAETLAPGQIALAVALTVVLIILVALPTHLLNSAVESATGRLGTWLRRGRTAAPSRLTTGPVPAALAVLLAGVISAFTDPAFGVGLAGLGTLASLLIAFGVEVVLGWFLVVRLTRRAEPGAVPEFRVAPATLLVVVAAVVFTRLTGFEPGIVFGLVAGVGFGAALAATARARVALVGAGYSFAVALVGWIAYALVPGPVFLRETFGSLAVAGIAALPIALLPLRGLAGFDVWSWNRLAWAGAYAVGMLGFFLVLMPMPFSWGGVHASLVAWIAAFAAYAVIAVGIWLVVVRPWRREPAGVAAE